MAKELGAINSGEMDPLNARRNQLTRQGLKPTFSPWEGFLGSFGGNWSVDYLNEALVVGVTNQFPTEKLDPARIKEEYGIDVDEPRTRTSAFYQAKYERERAEKQFILNNIKDTARGSTALPLIGSLLDGVIDPANILSMAAVGIPFGALGKAVGIAGKSAIVRAMAVGAELATEGAFEGFTQNMAMDIHASTFGYERSPEERKAIMVDSMIYNTLFGGLIHGAQFAYGKAKGRFTKAKTDTQYYENAKRPSDIYEKLDYQGKSRPGTPDYPGPKAGGDGVFYTVHHADSGNFSIKSQNNLGVELGGDGIILTSNNGRARNSAVQRPQAVNGQVLSVKIPELNLLDIDNLTNQEMKDVIRKSIGNDIDPIIIDEALNTGTTRDVLETISKVDELQGTDFLKKVNKALEETGIDGYTLRNKDASGALTADESLYLFDPNKAVVENIEEFNAKNSIDNGDFDVNEIVEKEMKYLESKDSHIYADPEANKAFDEMDPMPLEDESLDAIKGDIESLRYEMEYMDGELPQLPDDMDIDPNEVAKATDFCVRNNL